MIICESCEAKMYNKIEDGCSIARCSKCDNIHLNSIGLSPKSKYYNFELASNAVFDTVKKATLATLQVLQKRFSHKELEQIMLEWHEVLHNEILGEDRRE